MQLFARFVERVYIGVADNVEINVPINTSVFKRPIRPYKVAFAGVIALERLIYFTGLMAYATVEHMQPSTFGLCFALICSRILPKVSTVCISLSKHSKHPLFLKSCIERSISYDVHVT